LLTPHNAFFISKPALSYERYRFRRSTSQGALYGERRSCHHLNIALHQVKLHAADGFKSKQFTPAYKNRKGGKKEETSGIGVFCGACKKRRLQRHRS
jgi:hypothetical protein